MKKNVISLEENSNRAIRSKQGAYKWNFIYNLLDRRNNLEITGILANVEDQNLEEKVIEILDKIDVNVSSKGTEACHRIEKTSQKRLVRFFNRKHAKKPLLIEKVWKISIEHQ